MIKKKNSGQTVWMNVTTSANWNRPPVGIVRVEMALAKELEKIYGRDKFKRCVWMDGQFVEWTPPDTVEVIADNSAVDNIFPKTSSFDLARLFLASAIKRFGNKLTDDDERGSLRLSVPGKRQVKLCPEPGDVLISVGLDWDHLYTGAFFSLSRDKGVSVITCCYDLIPVLFPQYCVGEVAARFKEYFTQLSWGSSAVLCISKQTQKDYLSLCQNLGVPIRQTRVIPLGDQVPSNVGEVSKHINDLVSEPFILFVSTIERRKNHEVLYRAYHLLARQGQRAKLPKLVFVGMAGWGVGDILKDIELDPLTRGLIVQLNHVNDAELALLYQKTSFLVYPSLYEGWGLPVGEALAQGRAVLSSSSGSLPEVGGDLVRYIDPWNPSAWADAILDLVEHPEKVRAMEARVQHEYVARSWVDTAKVTAEEIDALLAVENRGMTLYAGYDLSTQSGAHAGPSIMSKGDPGYLYFGPYRALLEGQYRIKVLGRNHKQDGVQMNFDVVSDKTAAVHASTAVTVSGIHDETVILAELAFSLSSATSSFETRCFAPAEANVTIERIEVECV
jgi:glycosyltransferase involved in cell wall biosynthesis